VRRCAIHASAAAAGRHDRAAAAAAVAAHASKLRYRSLKLIYIALKRTQLTDYHWVYLLDEHFRVNRMSEQKNVSAEMVPGDRTILCIELSCWRDEPVWQASDEEIYRIALKDLLKMGYGVREDEVEDYYVADIATAYPVYELNFEDHLIPVLEGVHAIANVLTLGRHGLFLNNSMDDNVLLGMKWPIRW
jgi:protoporphyrinogen oxidase